MSTTGSTPQLCPHNILGKSKCKKCASEKYIRNKDIIYQQAKERALIKFNSENNTNLTLLEWEAEKVEKRLKKKCPHGYKRKNNCKECKKKQRIINIKKKKETDKLYYQNHKEKIQAYNQKYYDINKEEIKIQASIYYDQNKEFILAKNKITDKRIKRQIVNFNVTNQNINFTINKYKKLLELQNQCCGICGSLTTGNTHNWNIDHKGDKVRGLLCTSCNLQFLSSYEKIPKEVRIKRNISSFLEDYVNLQLPFQLAYLHG